MSGYNRSEDVPSCPGSINLGYGGPAHDWLPSGPMFCKVDEATEWECSWCGAMIYIRWWGWEFLTGIEHFEEAQEEYAALRAVDPDFIGAPGYDLPLPPMPANIRVCHNIGEYYGEETDDPLPIDVVPD